MPGLLVILGIRFDARIFSDQVAVAPANNPFSIQCHYPFFELGSIIKRIKIALEGSNKGTDPKFSFIFYAYLAYFLQLPYISLKSIRTTCTNNKISAY